MDCLHASVKTLVLIVAMAACGFPRAADAQAPVWQDNFDAPGIDTGKWFYDVGNGCQLGICGWGNSELQYYTSRPENARVENGNLVLEARREQFQGSAFTSARLKTEGRMHFKYGTLEARIRTPEVSNGLWPAYWMLGAIGVWPGRGEIDIMEIGHVDGLNSGVGDRRVGGAVHWDYQGNHATHAAHLDYPVDLHDDYRIYRLTWDPQFIRVTIDGIEYFEMAISDIEGASLHEFHQPHYLLLNLAVGGNYTGVFTPEGITAPLPGRMQVDYVRLYQDHPDSELYIGSDAAVPAGKFGVFTERTDTVAGAILGTDADLFLWNNLTPIPATPYEGSEVLAFRANAGQWYGMGIITDYRNLSAYAGGALKLRLRTTTPSTFKIGISSSFGDSWIDFVDGGEQYGLVRDGNWHAVSIPFSAFHDLDLHAVKQLFMLVSDPPAGSVDIFIDDVHYDSGAGGGSGGWTTRIEAENYAAASGIAVEPCSEGGYNVGWIDAGDWMVWDVALPAAGSYRLEYRVAGPHGGTIQLEKAGGSPVYASIGVPVTGGWQNWQTISHTVTLGAGPQQIAIFAPAGGYNIDWLQFTKL